MSYIRCTSNPEGLYVFHSTGGKICWMGKGQEKIDYIPANIFYKFVELMPHWACEFKRGSLEIKEICYPHKRKLNDVEKQISESFKERGEKFLWGNTKITLFYKGKEIARMWPVTWNYIYDGLIRDIKGRKKNKK